MPLRPCTIALAGFFAATTSAQTDPSYTSGALGAGPFNTYVSSNATPPTWNHVLPINDTIKPQLASGLIFIGPRGTDTHQAGPYIYNQTGELVWDGALDGFTQTMAYSVQQYQSKPVLAIWQGQFNAGGYGFGYNLLLNQSYQVVGNVTTDLAGLGADIHEFQITSNDTALLSAYNATERDLTSYGGPEDGYILDGIFQEVDIATGKGLFVWNALEHVNPSDCYVSPGSTGTEDSPWDYFHINSIEKSQGNYLVSSRHCHAVYYIDGTNGDILWTLGGKNSTFTGAGSEFYFQHDARFHSTNNSQISIFDNGATSWETSEATARGLLVDLDYANFTATLATEAIPYYNLTVAKSQGSVQVQENGNLMIGWGQMPWLGEHSSNGAPLWAAQFGVGDVQAYRAHRNVWNGYPTTRPAFVIQNESTVGYASWNGATEVNVWELLGSNDASAVVSVANTTAVGQFETNFTVPASPTYSYYQVRALDSAREPLGYSNFVSGSNGTTVAPGATQTPAVGAANATTVSSSMGTATNTASTSSSTSGASKDVRRSVLALVLGVTFACWQLV